MDSLIIDYSESDFADAIRALLPKGEYWQQTDNPELTQLINAMAQEFKTTHDDVLLSLLSEEETPLFGWKISDYQALLYQHTAQDDTSGTVSDNIQTPNLIYVELAEHARIHAEQAWLAFEQERLPHTQINWTYQSSANLHHQFVHYRWIRNQRNYSFV